jgi:hypothetical protein
MPLHTEAEASRPARAGRVAAVTPIVLAVLLMAAGSAGARQKTDLSGLDLEVRPGDVGLPPYRPLAERLLPPEKRSTPDPYRLPGLVDEPDRLQRTEIPNQRHGQGGSDTGDGGILEELIENRTIPLFRVRMQPPF